MREMTENSIFEYKTLTKNMKDYRGIINNFEVLGLIEYPKWHCKCNCGKYFIASKDSLRGECRPVIRGCLECFPANGKKSVKPTKIKIGDKFGKLEVIEEIIGTKYKTYSSKCDCGNIVTTLAANIKYKKDCGCSKYEKIEKQNWIGKKINRLTILSFHFRDWKLRFICQCECGSEPFEVAADHVKRGVASSCGCYQKEIAGEIGKIAMTGKFGPLSPRYNPGLSDNDRKNKRRKGFNESNLRQLTFKRDKFTCNKCGQKSGKLNCHHIQNWKDNKELRFSISNLCTFCQACHNEFHNKYGKSCNTLQQFEEFIGREWNPIHIELISTIYNDGPVFYLAYDPIYLGM